MSRVRGVPAKKRKSGIPTGNAGEYFVMGELLRQGFDAQLADRNTSGYDLLVGHPEQTTLRKVQVKTSRGSAWYVRQSNFEGKFLTRVTIYVLLGSPGSKKPVRFFIAKNSKLKDDIYVPNKDWTSNALISMKALKIYEDRWKTL